MIIIVALSISLLITGIWRGFRSKKKSGSLEKARYLFEQLEPRTLLSGSNAIDRLDLGDLASEASHNFEPGQAPDQLPLLHTYRSHR